MKKYIILLIFFVNISYAKNYSLYLASSKTIEVAAYFYYDIKKYTQNNDNVVIHKTQKDEYLILIKDIKSIQKANLLKRILRIRYKDSYIRLIKDDSFYNLVSPILSKKAEISQATPYVQSIEDSNRYITAAILFNTKEYQKAYEMFYDLFLEHSDNVNINYFLAKSAMNLKKYDEATAAFERVLIAKPDFDVARYEYANLLYLLKNDTEAKNEFETLLKKEIDTSIKGEIKKSLLVIENRNKKISGNLNLMIGLTTSSNVNNGLINTEYKLPGLNDITVEGEKPISDSAHNEAINLNLFNYLDSNPIRFKNSFLIYNKSFFNEKDQNFTLFSYKPSVDYLFGTSLIGLEFSLDKILKTTDEDFFHIQFHQNFQPKIFFLI